jgi:uncharacterized protein DUF4339
LTWGSHEMANEWYYAKDGQKFGPVTGKQLKELAMLGVLRRDDLIWSPGYSVWRPAKKFRGLLPKLDVALASPAMSLFWRPVDSNGESGSRTQSPFLEPDSQATALTPPLPPYLNKPNRAISPRVNGAPRTLPPTCPRVSGATAVSEVARTPEVVRPALVQPVQRPAGPAVAEPPMGAWAGMSLSERTAIVGGLFVLLLIYGVVLYRALA